MSNSQTDPYAQAKDRDLRSEISAEGDKHGGYDGGSCNGSEFHSSAALVTQFSVANSMMLTNGNSSVKRDDWILDGGANTHVVNDTRWFKEFHKFKLSVATADDGNTLEIQGGGSAELHLTSPDGDDIVLELSRVAYAPNVRCNILS